MATLRVLVVDDNVLSALTLTWLAEAEGCDARICQDGASAIAQCETYLPDIIFLDIGMRGLNGLEVCRLLRSRPEFDHVRIVAQTGWGDEKMRQRTAACGFCDHLVKPISPEQFRAVLNNARQAIAV